MTRLTIPPDADDKWTFGSVQDPDGSEVCFNSVDGVGRFIVETIAEMQAAPSLADVARVFSRAGEYLTGKLAEHNQRRRMYERELRIMGEGGYHVLPLPDKGGVQ